MDYETKAIVYPIVVGLLLVGYIAFIVWRHIRRQRREGNARPSILGAFLPEVSKMDNFARMSMGKLTFALLKRIAMLAYFAWAVAMVRRNVHDSVAQWVLIGLCGVVLTYKAVGGLFNQAWRDFGRCQEITDFIVPAGEFFIVGLVSTLLCWFYVLKFACEIVAIPFYMWKRKQGAFDDVSIDESVEDKATFGNYDESNDKSLNEPLTPFARTEDCPHPASSPGSVEATATLQDGTVIEKEFGDWHERGNSGHGYRENFDGTFTEK